MHKTVVLGLAWMAGCGLGAMFFGGLWWTVRRVALSQRPALRFLGSLLLRTSFVLIGLWVVSARRWDRLLLCLLGFVTARFVVTWIIRASGTHHTDPEQESSFAPHAG